MEDTVCILMRNMKPYNVTDLNERSYACRMHKLSEHPCIHVIVC